MNPSSTEDYLDSLLRAVQQKDNPIIEQEESAEAQPLAEESISGITAIPEEEELLEILEIPEEEELPEILEISGEEEIPEILETQEESSMEEAEDGETLSLEEIMPEEAALTELMPEDVQEEFTSVEDIQEEFTSEEFVVGGIDLGDELPPLEEVLGRLAAEEAVNLSVSDVKEPEGFEEEFNLDELLGTQINDEIVETSTLTGQEMYTDEIQNLSEDEIMSLLQKSSDPSSDDAGSGAFLTESVEKMDLDALLENMSEDSDIAGLQDLFEKSENNEPVSSEVEEIIELGLKVDGEEEPAELSVIQEPKQDFFGKLKGKLFSKKDKKNKKDAVAEENAVSENVEVDTIATTTSEEFLFDEIPVQDNEDLNTLFNFGAVSDFTETVDGADGTDALKDLMAETGGLFFDGVSDSATEPFSFDQLFEDTSNVQSGNSEVSDISDLLKSLESAEGQSDIFAAGDDLFAEMDSEKGLETIEGLLDGSEEESNKEKKPGLFSRLITFLTAEDEEDDSDKLSKAGVEKLGVTSEENKEAMEQLDKEGDDKKKKKKKDKKGKAAESAENDFDEDEEPQDDKKKKKKPKKEKKQKEPKPVEDLNEPVLSKKKVRSTFLFAFTIMAAILVCCIFIPELFEKKSARNAFYDGDYEACYQALYGKKLSESDSLIFKKAGFMLALERRTETYDNYMAVNDELRALESLIQEVTEQEEVMHNAEEYELVAEAEQSYQQVLQILSERYQVSEEEAFTISEYKQDALFTLHLKAIVAGEEFVCPDYLREDGQTDGNDVYSEDSVLEESEDLLDDILPAEEELTETEFEEGTN